MAESVSGGSLFAHDRESSSLGIWTRVNYGSSWLSFKTRILERVQQRRGGALGSHRE